MFGVWEPWDDESAGGCAIIVMLVVALVGVIGWFVLAHSYYPERLMVTGIEWQRVQPVEMYKTVHERINSWHVPENAFNSRKWTTESVYYTSSCSGSGKFKSCTSIPHFVTYYHAEYDINRWVWDHDLVNKGSPHDERVWPEFTPNGSGDVLGNTRAGQQREVFIIHFTGQDKRTFDNYVGYDAWKLFGLEQHYAVQINRLEQVQWDTLKKE